MTTPNQPKPSTLDTLLGIGSFQVDNGGPTNYGQGIDDGFVKSLFEIPLAGLDNMLTIFGDLLKRLPAGALDAFTSIIPGLNLGESGDDAVQKILDALDPRQIPQTVEEFTTWVTQVFGPVLGITTWMQQIFGGASADTPPPNLYLAPKFPAGSIAPNDEWVVDLTSSKTDDQTGSAKLVADGRLHALRSGATDRDVFTVAPGGTPFKASISVSFEGYVGTGETVLLQVVPYTEGVPGSPVTIASYAPAAGSLAWPGFLLSGQYPPVNDPLFGNSDNPVIPVGVTGVQTRLVVTAGATAGTFRFDDANATTPVKIRQEAVDGLPQSLAQLTGLFQSIIDTLLSALQKIPIVGGSLDQLFQTLGVIPAGNVTGAAGPATMNDSIFGVINAFLGGAVGTPGSTGGSLADVTNVSGQVSSNASQGAFAWQIVNILNNTPVARGMLPTGRANYDITSANTFLATTQSAALSSSFGLLQSMPIGVVSWYGYGSSGMSAFYINIRKVNATTGARDLVHHSGNIVGNLQAGTTSANADWMFYQIPTPLAGEATDNYYVEFVPVGGTHYIRGMSFTDNIKDHPYAASPCYGTTVDYSSSPNSPTSSLAKATSGPNVAWVEFAVSVGSVEDHREPQILTFTDDGESIPIPSWANRVDAIPLGRGGKGHAGTTAGIAGEPGQPGKFAPVTWERGTDFSGGSTVITFNVLSDGSAKLSIPSHDTTAAAGADGAGTKFGLTPVGAGPGVLAYNGQNYSGGVDQKVTGGAGADPGGAGNGGNGLFFQSGGAGGKAAGWVCFRQVVVPGEVITGDTTPPTAPSTVHLDSATFSTLTVTASGATDV